MKSKIDYNEITRRAKWLAASAEAAMLPVEVIAEFIRRTSNINKKLNGAELEEISEYIDHFGLKVLNPVVDARQKILRNLNVARDLARQVIQYRAHQNISCLVSQINTIESKLLSRKRATAIPSSNIGEFDSELNTIIKSLKETLGMQPN